MNSQTTPVHIRLWHHEFWLLVVAGLLQVMAVYMLIPVMPGWLLTDRQLSPAETGLAMGAFALGLYLLGPSCSWLVQRYRRNMVCITAIAAQAACVLLLAYAGPRASLPLVLVHRVAMGAAFGLGQMVILSTLVIDTCESHQRTEANHGTAWFARFALSLGPLCGLAVTALTPVAGRLSPLLARLSPMAAVLVVSALLALAGAALISQVRFPFRSPEECVTILSFDRFLLPTGGVLFANLLLVSMAVGLLLALRLSLVFYALVMGGFLLALLAQRFVFRNAELESEVVSGLILMGAAELILLNYPGNPLAPLLLGTGVGIVSSRFLLFFVKLSRHCQRGTSQSTYFLGWETGLAIGLGLGYALCYPWDGVLIVTSIALTAAALAMYVGYTHRWFLGHKNR
jgi:MFS family permease